MDWCGIRFFTCGQTVKKSIFQSRIGRAASASSFFWIATLSASRFFGSSSCDCASNIFMTSSLQY